MLYKVVLTFKSVDSSIGLTVRTASHVPIALSGHCLMRGLWDRDWSDTR